MQSKQPFFDRLKVYCKYHKHSIFSIVSHVYYEFKLGMFKDSPNLSSALRVFILTEIQHDVLDLANNPASRKGFSIAKREKEMEEGV